MEEMVGNRDTENKSLKKGMDDWLEAHISAAIDGGTTVQPSEPLDPYLQRTRTRTVGLETEQDSNSGMASSGASGSMKTDDAVLCGMTNTQRSLSPV